MQAAPTKVVIVEDEALVACDLERRLRKAGYEVPAIAASGEQALASIERTAPDLVLMDVHIQGPSDGIEVASQVRSRFQVPVVFLTAYADQATLERAKTAEPFSYLVKPIGHVNLASTIEVALYKHKLEQGLKSREAWLRTALQSMANAVVVTDVSGCVQFLNPAAERLTGWSHAEAVSQRLADVVHVVDFADREMAEELNAAVRDGVAMEFPREARLISREGETTPVEGRVAISRVDGHPGGSVLTFQDATARNWEETQIRQDQKMQVASRLASGIVRDFNRLLTTILRHSEQLLKETGETSPLHHRIKAIYRAGYSAAVLTGRVLGLCRDKPAQPRPLDLNAVIKRFLPMLGRMAGPLIQVETSLDARIGAIRADTNQMEQVLLNLVLNARDAMPQGGKLFISTANVELAPRSPRDGGPERFVKLAVQDNGAGMDGETAEHMFEPFFTSKKAGTGTGLGLAMVHAIVSASDGFIHVNTKPGVGSLFEIFLPRWEEQHKAAHSAGG